MQQKEEEKKKTCRHEEAMVRAVERAGPKPKPTRSLLRAVLPVYLPAPEPV